MAAYQLFSAFYRVLISKNPLIDVISLLAAFDREPAKAATDAIQHHSSGINWVPVARQLCEPVCSEICITASYQSRTRNMTSGSLVLPPHAYMYLYVYACHRVCWNGSGHRNCLSYLGPILEAPDPVAEQGFCRGQPLGRRADHLCQTFYPGSGVGVPGPEQDSHIGMAGERCVLEHLCSRMQASP